MDELKLWRDYSRRGPLPKNPAELFSRSGALIFERTFKGRTAVEVRYAGFAASPDDAYAAAMVEIAYIEGGSTPVEWYHEHVKLSPVPFAEIHAKATETRTH